MRSKFLGNRGDTIIEVLLALLIVSSVLAGAYVTSNHSLVNSRQAQERGEALKFVEAQIERLKAASALPNSPIFSTSSFCFDSSGNKTDLPASTPNSNINNDDFSTSGYPAACNFGLVPGGYHLSITQTNPKFTIRARWDRAGGGGRDEVSIVYKINQ